MFKSGFKLVFGFGFGALKGAVIVVIAFSLLVLGYDSVWGFKGRPDWISGARSYDFVDASSRSMVEMVSERRAQLRHAHDALGDVAGQKLIDHTLQGRVIDAEFA